MVFSTNQNRQFYVVSKVVEDPTGPTKLGEVSVSTTKDKKQFFFKHFGQGGLTRTDLIDADNVCYAKITAKKALETKLKKAVIKLDDKINTGKPIAGQDYIVRIVIHNYLAPGDANTTVKYGAVRAYAEMEASDFYKKLKESLEMNFSREVVPLFKFESDDSNGVTITEVEQPWNLGLMSQESVNFEVIAAPVRWQGSDVTWAKTGDDGKIAIEDSETTIGDGKKIADLEYFCMGERGDQYRDNVSRRVGIPTKLMVDPSKEYDVLDIHYYFSDTGVNSQKSEKDIILVAEAPAEGDSPLKSIKEKLKELVTVEGDATASEAA